MTVLLPSDPPAPEDDTAQDDVMMSEEPTLNSGSEGRPDYCTNLCPEQQVEIFMRLDIFASVYVVQDLTGLLEQLKAD